MKNDLIWRYDAIDALYDNSEAQSIIRRLMPAQQWIPAETPPKPSRPIHDFDIDGNEYLWHESATVVVHLDDGDIITAKYIMDDPCIGKCWVSTTYGNTLDNVTAWMQIPKM